MNPACLLLDRPSSLGDVALAELEKRFGKGSVSVLEWGSAKEVLSSVREVNPSCPLFLLLEQDEDIRLLSSFRPKAQSFLDARGLDAQRIQQWAQFEGQNGGCFSVRFQSFGYKYGVPGDCDVVLDCREVPNPYWVEALRPLSGLDEPVRDFLNQQKEVQDTYEAFYAFLAPYLLSASKKKKGEVVIGLGCTGGQHRSVYFANRLFQDFAGLYPCLCLHREGEWGR